MNLHNITPETEFGKALIKAATDENFYGKRKRDTKLECCEDIAKTLKTQVEPSALIDWFEKHKPIKKAPERAIREAQKPSTALDGSHGGHVAIVNAEPADGYICVSAQNNTAVSSKFVKALEQLADFAGFKILAAGFTYNKAGYQLSRSKDRSDIHYAPEIKPYLVNEPLRLFDGLVFAAELDILPTAEYPTGGHAGYHGSNSLIIGHPKVQLQPFATAQGEAPRHIYSTGACTVKNYIQQRAGQRAEAKHKIAALVVTPADGLITGHKWQAIQVTWDAKREMFYYLDPIHMIVYQVTEHGVAESQNCVEAITLGDIHSEKATAENLHDAASVLSNLEPDQVFLHDLHDFSSRNHHNRHDHWFIAGQGYTSVADDLKVTSRALGTLKGAYPPAELYVVRSNHDEALDRWLTDAKYDFKSDPINARLYLQLQSRAYDFIEDRLPPPDMLGLAMEVCGLDTYEATFLTRKCKIVVNGVICSDHGDCGANGSRATPKQLAKHYDKMNTGHTHSASIYDEVWTAGVTGSLYMGYNERGASSWSISHIVQFDNGSRCILTR